MPQHDQPKLELNWNGNARPFASGIDNRRKKHCDHSSCSERQHVHGSKEMPDALHQRKQATQRTQRLSHVVLVEIGIAKKAPCGMVMVEQPNQQGKNWDQRNRSALESVSTTVIAMRQDFPKRKCQRRDDGSLFAQDGQTKSKLAWPDAPLNIKSGSPERKSGSRKVGMSQGTLHKEDWIHGCGNSCGNSNASTGEPFRQQKDISQRKCCQKQHRDSRHSGFPSAEHEPQRKV